MLPDPELCRRPECRGQSRVVDTRNHARGYRVRRRECLTCRSRWTTYETTLHPKEVSRVLDAMARLAHNP